MTPLLIGGAIHHGNSEGVAHKGAESNRGIWGGSMVKDAVRISLIISCLFTTKTLFAKSGPGGAPCDAATKLNRLNAVRSSYAE
jgi:hypothetical protein